jgi:hypothetical protein
VWRGVEGCWGVLGGVGVGGAESSIYKELNFDI